MERPKRLGDLIGKQVKNTKVLETEGGTIFPVGTIFEVDGVWRGLTLRTVQPCNDNECHVLRRHYIKTVRPRDIELADVPSYPTWHDDIVGTCVVDACTLWNDEVIDLTLHDGRIIRFASNGPMDVNVLEKGGDL